MRTLTVDIETIPDQNLPEDLRPKFDKGRLVDPEKIKAAEEKFNDEVVKKLSVNPLTLQIVSLQMMDDSGFVDTPDDEKEMLELFWREASGAELIIGHNVISFDLPAIFIRSMIHGIQPKRKISLKKYSTKQVFDTMHVLGNWSNFISLDNACKRFGIEGKSGDGSEVYPKWKSGDLDWIHEYCKSDVDKTKRLYNKMKGFY